MTENIAAEIDLHIEQGACRCGCGDTPSAKRNFRPGHDQRLMGTLVRAARAGQTLRVFEQPETIYGATPVEYGRMVLTAQGQLKLERYLAAEPKRARRARTTAAQAAEVIAAPAAPKFTETEVKVGRWTYPAREFPNGAVVRNTRRDGSGEWIDHS